MRAKLVAWTSVLLSFAVAACDESLDPGPAVSLRSLEDPTPVDPDEPKPDEPKPDEPKPEEPKPEDPTPVDPGDPEPGVPCFGSKECIPDEYCATPEGECGREGVCTPVPKDCPRVREPVCSCDGIDYPNHCFAAQAKQNVDFSGTCPPPTCTSNNDCELTSYCATATGACGSAGACTVRPASCSGVWQPVCGCNKLTYANACKAAQVGVPVMHDGSC